MDAGYRLGLIYGYDERMSDLSNKSSVLPFPELYAGFKYKHVGVEISWAVAVITAKLLITF